MNWSQVCYEYDGSFAGFLTCVFESYERREEPVCFLTPEDGRYTLWDTRRVDTDEERAKRVWKGVVRSISPNAAELVSRGFLTCLKERELHIWRFIRYGFRRGARVMADLGDERVDILRKAVYHLDHEAHQYTGFVRFSDQQGVLIAEIEPQNRVLPLLRVHFVQRFNSERFIIYDRTHREALVYQPPGRWGIAALDDFAPGPPGEEERTYRRLWKRFFQTIAIEGRIDPKCQNTNLAKRYRRLMTEFMEEPLPAEETAPAGQISAASPALECRM